MIKRFKIRTIDGQIYNFYGKEIKYYNFEYAPEIIRFDFKDGSFVEFFKQNIVYIEAINEESEVEALSEDESIVRIKDFCCAD